MAAATNTTLGEIKLAGDLAGNNNANAPALTATGVTAGSYTLPTITVDAKGRITNAVQGTASSVTAMVQNASTTVKGVAQVGSGLIVDGNGVIGVPVASAVTRGGFKLASGGGLVMNGDSLQLDLNYLTRASYSAYGVVKVYPGAGLSVTDGVLSANEIPNASDTTFGVVRLGTGFANNATLAPLAASSTQAGVFKIGAGFRISGSGQLEIDPTFVASTSAPGLVKLGANIVNNAGVIDVLLDKATTTSLGLIKVGAGLSIDGSGVLSAHGAVSPPVATTSSLGVVQIGSNINVASGVISIPEASTTVAGAVKIGTLGITVSGGIVSLVPATNTTYGVVTTANSSEISLVGGVMTLGSVIARKNVANTWTGTQTSALVDRGNVSASVVIDLSAGNVQRMTLIGDTTLAAPTNAVPGGVYHIVIQQDATGGRALTLNTAFKLAGIPLFKNTPNSMTVISVVCIATNVFAATIISGF